jgi:hypothetical protein
MDDMIDRNREHLGGRRVHEAARQNGQDADEPEAQSSISISFAVRAYWDIGFIPGESPIFVVFHALEGDTISQK